MFVFLSKNLLKLLVIWELLWLFWWLLCPSFGHLHCALFLFLWWTLSHSFQLYCVGFLFLMFSFHLNQPYICLNPGWIVRSLTSVILVFFHGCSFGNHGCFRFHVCNAIRGDCCSFSHFCLGHSGYFPFRGVSFWYPLSCYNNILSWEKNAPHLEIHATSAFLSWIVITRSLVYSW